MGLSDGLAWKARSGARDGFLWKAKVPTVLDMRGSNPLSRSKRFTRGRSINYKIYSNMQKLIKELQNLYSWNQFYQARTMRKEMKTCQLQIKGKKQEINEFKMAQKAKRGGKK